MLAPLDTFRNSTLLGADLDVIRFGLDAFLLQPDVTRLTVDACPMGCFQESDVTIGSDQCLPPQEPDVIRLAVVDVCPMAYF